MNKKGQNFLEYALLIGCIALALTAMQVYFKRGIQGVIKSTHDDLVVPVEDFEGVNGQIYGMAGEMVDGQPAYSQNAPTTRTQDQEIVTTERARGERGFVINQDDSRFRSDSTSSMEMGDSMDYSLSAQGFNPRSSVSAAVNPSISKTASGATSEDSSANPSVAGITQDKIQLWPQYPGATVTPYYQPPPAVAKPDPATGTEDVASETTSEDSSVDPSVAGITQDKIQLWPQYPGATVTPYYQPPPAVAKPHIDPAAGTEAADPLGFGAY